MGVEWLSMKNKSIAIVILLSLLFLGCSLSKNTAVNSTKESNFETVADVEREIENKKIQIEDIKSKIEESVDIVLRNDIVLHDKIKNYYNDLNEFLIQVNNRIDA